MQEIQIAEQKKNHIKTIIALCMVILFVVLVTLYYQGFFGTTFSIPLPQGENTQNIEGENIANVLAQSVSQSDKENTSFPSLVTRFLGKWQGTWDIDGVQIPATLSVTNVIPNVGVTAWFGIENSVKENIIGTAQKVTGGIVTFPKKDNAIGLEFATSFVEGEQAIQVTFVFEEGENDTLLGEFIHPSTNKTVRGVFQPLK